MLVALVRTYFAIQTRKQEVLEQNLEDQKRLFLRQEMVAHNKHLAATAAQAGVQNYGAFINYGYQGLYGGLDSKAIQQKKKLKKHQKILDHMGSEELAANLFRTTQTDAKIKREDIKGEARANQTHFAIGRKVRQTIREIGGTMPEELPACENITKIESRVKKALPGQQPK
jgi:DNA-damage-inducible protein D